MNPMTKLQKIYTILLFIAIFIALILVVIKPYAVAKYIDYVKKNQNGYYICTLNKNGEHIGKSYLVKNNKKELIKTTISNSCIFSKPKTNNGFFIFAIGGGGGATPYESGNSGQVVSKFRFLNSPFIIIKIGKGGNGTILKNNSEFIDAKDGEATTINDLNIVANGGLKSSRMTPLGIEVKEDSSYISEKYRYLYDIAKSAKFGKGGQYVKYKKELRPTAENGHNGAVIIVW